MDNMCVLIMAGGKGTRFWPLSTEKKPKQFLKLINNKTMIRLTVDRVKDLIPEERIFISTSKDYIDLVREQIPEIPKENIIIEPYSKNTAPCIALAAFHISKVVNDATMVVLPSDHLVGNEEIFRGIIKSGCSFVNNNSDSIITIGIKPDRAETGYGYIKYSEIKDRIGDYDIIKVNKFVEKPIKEKAQYFLESGNYLWNAGMFIWKVKNILELTKKYMNLTYNILKEISEVNENEYKNVLEEKYKGVEELSVDYGIMEHAKQVYVIPGEFEWDDMGNWSSVERYSSKDEYKNTLKGEIFAFNSQENIVISNKKVLLNNIQDLIIVETDEYIMVSTKENEQEIKVAKEYFSI